MYGQTCGGGDDTPFLLVEGGALDARQQFDLVGAGRQRIAEQQRDGLADGRRVYVAAGNGDVGAGIIESSLFAAAAADANHLIVGGAGDAVRAEPGDAVVGRVLGAGRVEAVALQGDDQAGGRPAGGPALAGQQRLSLDGNQLRQDVDVQGEGAGPA